MKRIITLFTCLIISLGIMTSCGSDNDSETESGLVPGKEIKPDAAGSEEEQVEEVEETTTESLPDGIGDFAIELGGEIAKQDGKFVIEGKSNLFPGSRVVGELRVEKDDEQEVFSDTTELVQDDGSFYMELEDHQYGDAEFIVSFNPKEVQDEKIITHYGEHGENLEGPFIYQQEDPGDAGQIYKKAEVHVAYQADSESTFTLEAPEWDELPEDYGDPRVWIEVDETTEDGEYFYLNGHSNILEGAFISGSYAFNDDKTQVKPDGTFDFKIPYEYVEDENFVIEFDPSGLNQWDVIDENYGDGGDQLVGNLVEVLNMSDNQIITKEIPWEEKEIE